MGSDATIDADPRLSADGAAHARSGAGQLARRTLLAAPVLTAAGAAMASDVRASAGVERFYVSCRFGQLHMRRAGTSAARTPVLMFHQVPNSGQIFEAVLPLLGEDRRVFAADTPGYGMSDPAPDPQSIAAYADAMADGIRALGLEAVDLVGYHTGAAIAAALAQRPDIHVRRLALVAVPVFTAAERASFGSLPPIPFDEDGDWAREEWRRSWHWRGPGQTREDVLKTFAEKMRPGARLRGATAIAAYDMAASLTAVTVPLMIVRPKDDLWDATARARALRPDAGYKELPEFGHGLWAAAPALMNDLLRAFLDA